MQIFRHFGRFSPQISAFVLPMEAVILAPRDTSALLGPRFNRDQPPHAHQIIRHDGQPVEPIHPIQSAQLHLAQRAFQLRPAESPLDQLSLALIDRPSWIRSFLFAQAILLQIALHILADVRCLLAIAKILYKLLVRILGVSSQRDPLLRRTLVQSPVQPNSRFFLLQPGPGSFSNAIRWRESLDEALPDKN